MEYTQLKLEKKAYDDLISDAKQTGKYVIVFQFTYLTKVSSHPTLKAYVMKQNHKEIKGSRSHTLDFLDNNPKPYIIADSSSKEEQVLGDLQVAIRELEKTVNNNDFEYLLFTPFIDEENHICFDISVVPKTPSILGSTKANPSPPRDAI